MDTLRERANFLRQTSDPQEAEKLEAAVATILVEYRRERAIILAWRAARA